MEWTFKPSRSSAGPGLFRDRIKEPPPNTIEYGLAFELINGVVIEFVKGADENEKWGEQSIGDSQELSSFVDEDAVEQEKKRAGEANRDAVIEYTYKNHCRCVVAEV